MGGPTKKPNWCDMAISPWALPSEPMGIALERERAPGRLNHRAADTLHEAKQDQLKDILRKPAEKRAQRHHGHAETVHLVMAVDVAETAADNTQADAGHLINDQRPRNPEHVGLQSHRQGRHGDHEHARRNPGDGNTDYRIDQRESADWVVGAAWIWRLCGSEHPILLRPYRENLKLRPSGTIPTSPRCMGRQPALLCSAA